MCTLAATLRSSIEKHNDTFESLLKLIPAQYYLQEESSEQVDDKGCESENGDDMEEEQEIVPMPESGGIEDLRKKLQLRMEELRRRKKGLSGEAGDRDELLEERRRQRAAMRERRRKETKEKIRREAEKKGKEKQKEVNKGPQTKNQLLVPDVGSASKREPQANYTNVTFSSITGPSKKGQQFKTTANPRQALEQMAARKEKMANLPEEKRMALEEREKWAKVEAKLEGVKVRDDEARLKKSMKRKDKEKSKSKKAWGERKEQVAAAMAVRQKKRADNIATRNERRKKKGGKAKARPGFEGKTFGKAKAKAKASK